MMLLVRYADCDVKNWDNIIDERFIPKDLFIDFECFHPASLTT